MRGRSSCSTCCSACCAISTARTHVTYVRNITDVDDKINARAAERGIADPRTDRGDLRELPRGRGGARLPAADGRAARDRAHRGDEDADRAAGRLGQRLRGRGARAVQRALDAGLRQALEALARRDGRGRARRCRALQARRHGLRAVEALEGGRARLAVARRHQDAGPSRLAHRVLGDELEASRRDLRHPRRRHRSRVSAPRERDRAVALRLPHAA